jgi:uncharacterized protein (DUF111 family)
MVNSGYSKEEMKEYMKDYVKNSKSIKCECGGKYKTYNKYIHIKSEKHNNYTNNLNKEINDKIKDIVFDDNLKSKFIEFLNNKNLNI